jgi:hypothetical protein
MVAFMCVGGAVVEFRVIDDFLLCLCGGALLFNWVAIPSYVRASGQPNPFGGENEQEQSCEQGSLKPPLLAARTYSFCSARARREDGRDAVGNKLLMGKRACKRCYWIEGELS